MLGRAVLGASLARRPVVVKLVADEAYERARRWGLFDGDLDAFQHFAAGVRVRLLRDARDRALRRVSHLVCPSDYLAALAVGWGVPRERVTVLPNAAPALPVASRPRGRARYGSGWTGRCSRLPGGSRSRSRSRWRSLRSLQVDDVSLLVAGDGPELPEVRRRVTELGSRRPRSLSRAARARRTCSRSFALRTRRSSPRRGRTSRTPSSRRSPSGRR